MCYRKNIMWIPFLRWLLPFVLVATLSPPPPLSLSGILRSPDGPSPAMKLESMVRLPSSPRGGSCWPNSLHLVFVAAATLLCLASCVEGLQESLMNDWCASYEDIDGWINVFRSSRGRFELENVCAGSDESFCFPSTLMGFLANEDGCREPTLEAPNGFSLVDDVSSRGNKDIAAFKLSNGEIFTCSFVGSINEIHGNSEAESKSSKNVESCRGPPVPNVWMQSFSGIGLTHNKHPEENEQGLQSSSSLPHIEISPPLLDWGTSNLYSPSLAFLTVTNSYNESILDVYEPYSSDPQFYVYDFNNLSLSPGEAASIAFVFLPRQLGLSSAHLVLQTNFGGFIVQAKGMAAESPFRVKPLVAINIPSYQKLNRNLSLYNPFDEAVYVEEVAAWVSSSCENAMQSSHVACSKEAHNQSPGEFSSVLDDHEWYTVNNGELGLPLVEFRPHGHWKIPPKRAETIIEMNLSGHSKGKVLGVICMQLHNSRSNKSDRVIIPVEVEAHGRATYHALSGSFSAFFEPLMPCDGTRLAFILYLRNSSPYLLSVIDISETAEGLKLFKVKYTKGLIVFPGTVTQVAFISYSPPFDLQDILSEVPTLLSKSKLLIMMNDSTSPQIEIPFQDFVRACSWPEPDGILADDDSYIGLKFEQVKEKSMTAKTGPLESITGESTPTKILEVLEVDGLILRNWKSQGTMSKMSVLKDRELLFPVVQIGTHFSKWITVYNPSHKPVVIQLLLNSAVIVDQCQLTEDSSMDSVSSRFTVKAHDGFSIEDSAITEAMIHPFSSAAFGPVVFRPSNQCMWRSSVLIRNNLSGVEWLPLRAFGGSHSLVLLEGSKPVQELEFRLDLPVTENLSSPESVYLNNNASCVHLLSKELYAKNTGKVPLEVIELGVSGSDCGLDGFMIHTCKGFALSPGESMRLNISYQSDFSVAVVRRDLKLAMANGDLVIPMKASLPIHMVNLCKKGVFWTVPIKSLVLMVAALFITSLVFSILSHAFFSSTEEYFVKDENTVAAISKGGKPSHLHRNARKTRLLKEDVEPEVALLNTNSDCQSGYQGNTQRIQEQLVSGHQKSTIEAPPFSTTMAHGVHDTPDTVEAPQSGNLTVKVVREKGRRRKKRSTGAGLAAIFDVSSSQSGNSTPSSPLSPNTSTPKQVWPLSPDTLDNPFSTTSNKGNRGKKREFGVSAGMHPGEPDTSSKSFDSTSLPSAPRHPSAQVNSTRKPSLSSSATFPCTSWHAPGVANPDFLVSTSPIALHARAPGSKISKQETTKREEGDVLGKEFIYDIWGNNFSDHLRGTPKELLSKVYDASEGDSHSFFSRDPQSLMMMPSAPSVSPGQKMPSYGANCFNEVN